MIRTAGRTLTVGELRRILDELPDMAPVMVTMSTLDTTDVVCLIEAANPSASALKLDLGEIEAPGRDTYLIDSIACGDVKTLRAIRAHIEALRDEVAWSPTT